MALDGPQVRVALLFLLMFAFAASAEARTLYLSPIGSDSSTTYTSPSPSDTALRTLTKALTLCQTNDTLRLGNSAGVIASGKYAAAFAPADQYRSYQGLTVLGDSTAPYKTVLSGILISAGSGLPKLCGDITFNGVVVDGNVDLNEDSQYGGNISGFMMRNCVVRRSFYAGDASHSLYKCRIGVNLTTAGAPTDSVASRHRIHALKKAMSARYDSTRLSVGPTTSTDYSELAFEWQSQSSLPVTVEATRCTLRVFVPENWSPGKLTIFRMLRDSRFTDCLWQIADSSNSTPTGDANAGFLFRDGQIDNVFHRNTWNLHTYFSGKGRGVICFAGSGATTSGRNNVHRFSTFKSNIPSNGQLTWHWKIQEGDSFYFNTVLLSTGGADDGIFINNVDGNCYFGNNTLVNYGTGGVLNVNVEGDDCRFMPGRFTFENNIVYSQSAGTTSADYGVGIKWRDGARQSDFFASDFNLYAHYGSASGGRSLYAAPCPATLALHSPATMNAAYGLDGHSLHGSPRFTDSTFANFNGTLLSNSAARCVGRDGESMGAVNSDCVRPDEIEDLRATAVGPTTVVLVWTATGDDSLTGSGATYDIRRHTSPITELNWSSATAITGEPTPSEAGSVETLLVTGLTANTLYYFAMKVRDEYENESALSNVASRTTPESGPDIEAP